MNSLQFIDVSSSTGAPQLRKKSYPGIRRSMSTVLFWCLFPLHHFPINFMLSSEGHTCWARLKVLIWSKPKKWIFEGTRARKPKTDETGGENLGELGCSWLVVSTAVVCMLPELTCLLSLFFLGCTKLCHPVTKGDARESEDESMNIFEYV